MIYDRYQFKVPSRKLVRVIMDSDAKNEADDQFAIVQGLLSPKFDNVGIIAAHFGRDRYEDSMERSYQEIAHLLELMDFPGEGLLFHGAEKALPDVRTPVDSQGARLIIREAMRESDRPLYLAFMGPLTDVASALLMEPRIEKRLTLIWIGGGAYPQGGPEFNLGNDINAANVIFSSRMDVWQVPKNVYEQMPVSLAELEARVYPCGRIGRYLVEQLHQVAFTDAAVESLFRTGETWVLGDSPSVGLILYENRFEYDWQSAPRISRDMSYLPCAANRPIRVYRRVDSRLILEDFYAKLKLFALRAGTGYDEREGHTVS